MGLLRIICDGADTDRRSTQRRKQSENPLVLIAILTLITDIQVIHFFKEKKKTNSKTPHRSNCSSQFPGLTNRLGYMNCRLYYSHSFLWVTCVCMLHASTLPIVSCVLWNLTAPFSPDRINGCRNRQMDVLCWFIWCVETPGSMSLMPLPPTTLTGNFMLGHATMDILGLIICSDRSPL